MKMKEALIIIVLTVSACNKKNIEFQMLNLTLETGVESKIEYVEVFHSEQHSAEELLYQIKQFNKITFKADSLKKYSQTVCYYYKHSTFVNYNSYAGKNTSNLEEGGVRDWDNPTLYNMGNNLLARVAYDSTEVSFVLYKKREIILKRIEHLSY